MAETITQKSRSVSLPPEKDEIDLREVFNLIKHSYKLIVLIVTVFLIGGIYYAQTRPPIYLSSAIIKVGDNDISNAVGAGKAMASLSGLASQQSSTGDVESVLIRSPYVLNQVVNQLGLDISVSPHHSGFFAREMARFKHAKDTVTVSNLYVPNDLLAQPLILIAKNDNQYSLFAKDGKKILDGVVGRLESGSYFSQPLTIQIASLSAKRGAKFDVVKSQVSDVANGLASGISIKERGTATGILQLSYASGNPVFAQKLVNTVLQIAVVKNVNEKSHEAAKTLQFISRQLPVLENHLEATETKLNQYGVKTGVFNAKENGPEIESRINNLQNSLDKLKLKKTKLLQNFTSIHPLVIAETQMENQIRAQIEKLKIQLRALPLVGEKEISLSRDAKIQSSIYKSLVVSAQSMEMMKASTVSSIRILSPASYPTSRIPINKRAIVLGAGFLGLMISLCIIFIRHVLSPVIEDPDEVERKLGISVAAIIPYSEKQAAHNKKIEYDKLYANSTSFILARKNPKESSIESMRSLRTAIQMALLEAKGNVISITGSSPGIGKSFISSNLAVVLSDLGMRVIIVDADIRLGKMYQSFGKTKTPGLSSYLKNEASLDQVIQTIESGKLDFISTGLYPENPSELLSQKSMPELIKKLSSLYDLVVIDTPPILAVVDSALILRHSSVNFMVLGVGKDQMKEVLHAKSILENVGVTLTGIVFNTLKQKKSGFGYNYGYTSYHYNYEN